MPTSGGRRQSPLGLTATTAILLVLAESLDGKLRYIPYLLCTFFYDRRVAPATTSVASTHRTVVASTPTSDAIARHVQDLRFICTFFYVLNNVAPSVCASSLPK